MHQSYFALDWNQGLFYFSTESIIYVVNMKTTVVEEHIIYSTETTIITGLAVKPDEAKLVWLEYSKINFSTWIMEGTQVRDTLIEIYLSLNLKYFKRMVKMLKL